MVVAACVGGPRHRAFENSMGRLIRGRPLLLFTPRSMGGPGSCGRTPLISTCSYSFGDSPTAADRLAVMARVFEPEMRVFLAKWSHLSPELAIDLGCGPGYTTRLLAEILGV